MQAILSALDMLIKLKQAECDHPVQDRSLNGDNKPFCTKCGKLEYAE